jgi:hypothetical protein
MSKRRDAVGIAGRGSLTLTHLVVNLALGLLQVDCLGENIALLLELNALGPVVECTRHVDLVGGMLPIENLGSVSGVSDMDKAVAVCSSLSAI